MAKYASCFNYGNAETTCNDEGNGNEETVYFGMGVILGSGRGEGPWVMADLKDGSSTGTDFDVEREIKCFRNGESDGVRPMGISAGWLVVHVFIGIC